MSKRTPNAMTGLFIILAALLAPSPAPAEATDSYFTTYKERPILQIKIWRDGTLHAADKKVSLTEVDNLLEELAERKGSVWYFREGPETRESVELADKVINLVLKHGTPICLSETPDYKNCRY